MFVQILVKDSEGQEVRRYHPHEYFIAEQPNLPGKYDLIGAYGKSIASSELIDITMDVVKVPSPPSSLGKFIHVLEFVTAPLRLTSNINQAMIFTSNTVNDLYAFVKKMYQIQQGTVELEDWIKSYNAKAYTRGFPINKSKILVPENVTPNRTSHPYLQMNNPIDPRFAIHVNTSILLEQVYTLEMREAFPIFESYPPMVNGTDEYGLKNWPSCMTNPRFEAFELRLTKSLNSAVDDFVRTNLNDLRPYSMARICGFFRMLIYCYIIMAYCESYQKQIDFCSSEYELSSDKDFFLHGIPKVQFDWISSHGLIRHEKEILKLFLSKNTGMTLICALFSDVLTRSNLKSHESPWFITKIKIRMMDVTEFINHVIILPLFNKEIHEVKLVAKTLEQSLPRIMIDDEIVDVPVLEFRAPLGNGCTLEGLEKLLTSQAANARSFAKKGFEAIAKYSPQQVKKHDRPII
jgi:hypothetical protein